MGARKRRTPQRRLRRRREELVAAPGAAFMAPPATPRRLLAAELNACVGVEDAVGQAPGGGVGVVAVFVVPKPAAIGEASGAGAAPAHDAVAAWRPGDWSRRTLRS